MPSSRKSRDFRESRPSSVSFAKVTPLESPLPDNTPAVPNNSRRLRALLTRGRSRLHRFVKYRVVEADWFAWLIIAVILVNSIALAMATVQDMQKQWNYGLEIVESICLVFYCLEFVLKIYADPIDYWFVFFNVFDFIILFLSLLQFFLASFTSSKTGFQIFRVFRLVRIVRVMRTVRFVKGLEVLVVALWETARKWLISLLFLLLILIYFFAIVGHNIFGKREPTNWSTLRLSFTAMASYVTSDGWYDRQSALESAGFIVRSRLFTLIVIWILNFVLSNLFVAVILMNIEAATSSYKEEEVERKAKILRHKKELMMMQQREGLKQLMVCQRKGSYQNFEHMVADFEKTLKHEDIVVLPDLCTNIVWLETYILTMENMTDTLHNVQQFHFEMANILTKALELNLHSKYGISASNF